jgi:YaiO family outer membrane protein
MLTYRKYKQDANNYVGVDVSVGFSPEVYRFEFEGNENAIVNLKSQKLNLGYYFTSKNNKHAWGIQTGISHQEKSFEQGSYFWIYSLALSWDLKFK